jgi:hypothetical protein
MRRGLAVPIPAATLLDDVFLPLSAYFRGYKIIFDADAVAFDYPTALRSEFRRKVRTQAGVYQIVRAYPQLLFPTTWMWFHFASHKLGRLLLPAGLLAIAISSFGLPSAWRTVVLAAQVAFYSLASIDGFISKSARLKRVSSIARTFVVLVGAALLAPFFLLANRNGVGWQTTTVQSHDVVS